MKNPYSFFKWAGIVILLIFLQLPNQDQNVKATGEGSPSFRYLLPDSPEDAWLEEADLPGFRQAEEIEVTGTLALAKRITSGLSGSQGGIANLSIFRAKDLFRSEYVISFLVTPISKNDETVFDALAGEPQSILETLTGIAETSGNTEAPRQLFELGHIGEESMGFSMVLGQEPVAQSVDFLWARRGEIIQSTWVIHPVGETPSINLRQLGLLVDERVAGSSTFRPAGLLVPVITTYIPTPLDISTRPAVIGTNLLLAALMMLPFAVAAEIFTRLSAEREELLREKLRLTRWLLSLQGRFERFLGTRLKGQDVRATSLRLFLIMFFYGLTFSLLDPTWKPFSVTGLVLFLNMTVAYGVVGIADDLIQWRVLKKWRQPAELKLRPTNIFIAAASTITSRLLSLVPGLMFGTPEALVLDEVRLGKKRRNHLHKISAYTLLAIGFGLWALTTLTAYLQRQNIPDMWENVIGGVEAFLLVVFAVALENTFIQMLGLPGSFGEALRKRSRWLWLLGLTGITFVFYHTLINPRGELAEALQESNVWIFLGAMGAFVVLAFGSWAYLSFKGRKTAVSSQPGRKKARKGKKFIPAWVWLAVSIIGVTVVGVILISLQNQGLDQGNAPTPTTMDPVPTVTPSPTAEVNQEIELAFNIPAAVGKLCFVQTAGVTLDRMNSYAWRSIQLAAAQYGAQARSLEPEIPDEAGYYQVIAQFIEDDCDLIVGNWLAYVFQTAANENPDQNFMLVVGEMGLPNLWTTEYSLPEGAYLAGTLAAAVTQSGAVGTFGGMGIPFVVSSMNCFNQGVMDYNEAHKTDVAVLGWNSDTRQGSFTDSIADPEQGTSLTNDLISQGADIIFPLAGASPENTGYGTGLAALQHAEVALMGVDLDWAWAMPEFAEKVITSVETRYDQSIALAVDALANGEFSGGIHEGTLASGEIALTPLRGFSGLVSAELRAELAQLATSPAITTCQIQTPINGFLNLDAVDGYDWPANRWVTIRIFTAPGGELLFTGESMTDQDGHFYHGVGVDLVPGMAVEVTEGTTTESVTLVPFTIEAIDPDEEFVSGTAPSAATINIIAGEHGSEQSFLTVTADDNGLWQASFGGQFDITNRTLIQATTPGANGNGTVIKISLEEMPGQPSTSTAIQDQTSTPRPTATPDKGVLNPE